LIEQTVRLEDISLIDFLGLGNKNIDLLISAFPRSKIISRGNEIHIKGTNNEVIQIVDILNALIDHFHQFGQVTEENIQSCISKEEPQHLASNTLDDILLYGSKGIPIKIKSTNQRELTEAIMANDLVFVLGPAGTGKTYISVAMAVRALKLKLIKKIVITRPAVEAGESLGFLPGDMKEKIDPYLRPIFDALYDMIPPEKLKHIMDNQIIEIAPLAYMRGRTLNNAYILLDEAQNTTAMQMKMFLTRMGPNSKMIVNGDISQIDLLGNKKSGLKEAIKILEGVPGIHLVKLTEKDVVRHKLVRDIILAYEKLDQVY